MIRSIWLLVFSFVFMTSLPAGSFPIDVVYTWVNGEDEEWQKQRDDWFRRENPDAPKASEAGAKRRFRDREELRYSLRSILAYMPEIHHIYIVTCGQKPAWMIPHPKISFIHHRAIFTNLEDLPTFNSMAIESNLHRIPGLKEHYIYFNDDVFLMQNMDSNDFFTEDGKPKIFLGEHFLPVGPVFPEDKGYEAACKNTANLLNIAYGRHKRFTHAHTPFPSTKSLVEKSEALFPSVFSAVSSHHFRSQKDFTMTNGLIPYVALYTEMGEMSPFTNLTWSFGVDREKDERVFLEVQKNPPQFLCLQDAIKDDGDTKEAERRLKSYFQILFPERAPWEKDPGSL